jgi:hypothetical protein
VIDWTNRGLDVKVLNEKLYGSYTRTIKNENFYFRRSVSFTTIGNAFAARSVTYPSCSWARCRSGKVADFATGYWAMIWAARARFSLVNATTGPPRP